MSLKKITALLLALFFFTRSFAQPPLVQMGLPVGIEYGQANTVGGIVYQDAKGKVLFRIGVNSVDSSNTSVCYPTNKLNIYTNFSYYTNCTLAQVHFSVDASVPIENMLYSITGANDSVLQWKKLEGHFQKQQKPGGGYVTTVYLDPIECESTVFTVRLYNTKNPEAVLTQIVSTVPIEQPKLFGKLVGYGTTDSVIVNGLRVARQKQEQKDLETAKLTTLEMPDFSSGDLFLNTDNTPYVYSVYLIRDRKGGIDTVPIYFIWAELTEKIIRANKFFDLDKAPYRKIYNASIPIDMIRAPGRYELLVVPTFEKDPRFKELYAGKQASIKFEVHPSTAVALSSVIIYAALLLVAALLFFAWYKRRQKRTMRQQEQRTREAKLKLEAVRSQLNPHFIFNALAGIQALMNKNEGDKANHYLATFSRITRSVLDKSAKELIPVEEEIKWLTDYLEMEQLRFGFQYAIKVGKGLDVDNTEIPAMLLQPFVENAIKHGVSSLKEAGQIALHFQKMEQDLQVSISDNGGGYDSAKEHPGVGLSLSKSRLALLNTIYKDNPAQLTIDSNAAGTTVIVRLKNWLW